MTEASPDPIRIFVDADACPVKAETYKVAARHGLRVIVVANIGMAVPRDPMIEIVVVGAGLDVADDWIVDHLKQDDIVITSDVPLASRALKAGSVAIAPNGRDFTPDSIGMALATRNLLDGLRSAGAVTGGPPPFTRQDRSAFLGALDRAVVRAKRRRIA